VHEHQVTVCGNDVPAYFLRRAWDFGKREVAPRHGRLRLCPILNCSEQFHVCLQPWSNYQI
jgi:hypothetical protein